MCFPRPAWGRLRSDASGSMTKRNVRLSWIGPTRSDAEEVSHGKGLRTGSAMQPLEVSAIDGKFDRGTACRRPVRNGKRGLYGLAHSTGSVGGWSRMPVRAPVTEPDAVSSDAAEGKTSDAKFLRVSFSWRA